jgi:hypothetical protein
MMLADIAPPKPAIHARALLRRIDPRRNGLRLFPTNRAAAVRAVGASVLGATLFILVLDALVFRRSLPPGYVAFYTSPLLPRTPVLCAMAAIEEFKFRLLLMTGLTMAIALWRERVSNRQFIAIILASQLCLVWQMVLADPLYGALRYWAVGAVWGWLYWRHGWLAGLAGHMTTHLLLDPLLLVSLGSVH